MKANRILLQLVLAVAAAAFAATAAAAMYKWTDSAGNVHYSETPPDEGNVKEIAPPPPIPSATAEGDEQDKKKEEAADNGDEQEKPLTPEQQSAYSRNCEAAKANLEIYKSNQRVLQADGKELNMNEETRQKKIQQSEEQIKKFCR